MSTQIAYFACGCFWGVQHYMNKAKGVIETECGYMGGKEDNPTYIQVKAHETGHAEVLEVRFNPEETTYEELCKLFFEIHDPAQVGGIGTDLGPQYRSEIFYRDEGQLSVAKKTIDFLKSLGYEVNTQLTPAGTFWKAEDYHQHYFEKNGGEPDCHFWVKKFS